METASSKAPGSRFHDMDLARSWILLSGVFFHAAFLYSTQESWYASGPYRNAAFDAFIGFVRTFRMESLFIVSGFFSAMLVTRSGTRGFAYNRFVRMGVPLLFCGLTFNTAMILISDDARTPGWSLPAHFLSGFWSAHLWNMANLLGYETVVFCTLLAFPALHRRIADSGSVALLAIPAYVVVGVLAYVCWDHGPSIPALSILFRPKQLALYLPAYMLGYVLHQNTRLRDAAFRPAAAIAAVAVLAFVRHAMEAHIDAFRDHGTLVRAVDLLNNLSRALLLFSLVRVLQTRNPWIKRISLASYTVYVLHLPLQIALFRIVDPILPGPAGFVLIAATSFAISWAIHLAVVERWAVAGFLLNGKVYTPKTRSF